MKSAIIGTVLLLVCLFAIASDGRPQQPTVAELLPLAEEAKANLKRLPPSAFPQLPKDVAVTLEQLGCTVPQTLASTKPHNVMSGEFARRGQRDWAISCSRNGHVTTFVVWGGTANCPPIGEPVDEIHGFQWGGSRMEYSWMIQTASPTYIIARHRAYKVPLPLRPVHDGIEFVYLGKGSSVKYCHRGKWRKLQGAD